MASFNPKVFIRPDGLKRIANVHLIALLEPWRAYFSWRGFEFPASADEEFPHEELAKILLTYDPEMPIELMNVTPPVSITTPPPGMLATSSLSAALSSIRPVIVMRVGAPAASCTSRRPRRIEIMEPLP